MLTKLKKKVQEWLVAEAKVAHKMGLTPNKVSFIGITLAFFSALTYALWQTNNFYLPIATILLLLSGFCDALDGVIARTYKEATPFGGFLDSLLDRYADAIVYAGIILGGLCDALWGLIALISSLLVSYSRARAEAAGIQMESIGLAERAERIIILAITSIIAFLWEAETKTVMNAGIILLAILSNLTVLQRCLHVYKKLKPSGA
ncbi:MAG: phosphatidylglycerophosphate synthase [Candidatus Bathyarchaeota archaeon]|nr:MAG: phosphatidylglycerophosphate synthase [Candidatus Bathyarchaeota archaeon]